MDDDQDGYEDAADDWRDDDWRDDDLIYAKDEPDCPACYDTGCRSCEPGRLDRWRASIRWSVWRLRRRVSRKVIATNEPPF